VPLGLVLRRFLVQHDRLTDVVARHGPHTTHHLPVRAEDLKPPVSLALVPRCAVPSQQTADAYPDRLGIVNAVAEETRRGDLTGL
jgi:hypothetical protein